MQYYYYNIAAAGNGNHGETISGRSEETHVINYYMYMYACSII
jgi:hypothetical protein